jgi:hypothetical protein
MIVIQTSICQADKENEMPATTPFAKRNPLTALRKLKVLGIIGPAVRIRNGKVEILTRTPREAYRNGSLLQALMYAYYHGEGPRSPMQGPR